MKVLLVATNRERSPYPVAPLGALCVAAAARQAGHEVEFLDLAFTRRPERALFKTLKAGEFDVVAFSIRNLDNCSYFMARSYAGEIRALAGAARAAFNGPLILGGSGFSIAPNGWMKRLRADYGIVGEGEEAFPELLNRIAQNPECATPNAGCDSIITHPSHPSHSSHPSLPSPAHGLCRYQKILARGGFISVQTKRGCPFGCIYCIYPQLEGQRYRLRQPARVVDEIAGIIKIQNQGRDPRAANQTHFFFTDSVFNDPREHALEICTELARRRLPVRWMAFCNPIGFDEELARAMAAAGCIGVEFGLDAATEKMLAALHKPFTQGQIRVAFAALANAGIPFAVHMLFGGPGETWRDVEDAQRFLNDCAPANGIFASFGIRVYEGTAIERLAVREGLLPEGTDLFEPVYYVSPAMDENAAGRLDAIVRRRPEWSSPVDWQKRSMRWIQALMNRLGVRPQWKNVRNYGLHMRRK